MERFLYTQRRHSVATIIFGGITANQMTKSNWLLTYRLLGQYVTAFLILYTGNPVVIYPSTVAHRHWMCFCQMWRCLTVSTPSSMLPWRSWTQRQPRWLKTRSHFCPIMLKLCSWWKTSELYSRTWRRLHLVNPVHPHDPRSNTLHVLYMFRSDMSFIASGDIVHQVYSCKAHTLEAAFASLIFSHCPMFDCVHCAKL